MSIISNIITAVSFGKTVFDIIKEYSDYMSERKKSQKNVVLARDKFAYDKTKIELEGSCCTRSVQLRNSIGSKNIISARPSYKPILYLSQNIQNDTKCFYVARCEIGLKIENPIMSERDIDNIFQNRSSDCVIVVTDDSNKKANSICFSMWNIVPGADEKYYQLRFKLDCIGEIDEKSLFFSEIMRMVFEELLNVYKKYRAPISSSIERLNLEARILYNMGYSNISFRETSGGYGLSLPLKRSNETVLIEVPCSFPATKPLVVLKKGEECTNVDFNVSWHENYTLGHIIRALEEGR